MINKDYCRGLVGWSREMGKFMSSELINSKHSVEPVEGQENNNTMSPIILNLVPPGGCKSTIGSVRGK